MKLACGYKNGIGNFIVFTSVIKALQYHSGEKNIDVFLDEEWIEDAGKPIFDILSNLSCATAKKFPSEFNREDYDILHMSVHSVFTSPVYSAFLNTNELDITKYTAWGNSFLSERDFYYLELVKELNYKGPIFSQEMPYDKKFKLPKNKNIKVTIANGYQRTNDDVFKRKQYPHWAEVCDTLKRMYLNIDFYILGGSEDTEWSEDLASEIGATDFSGKLSILETAAAIKQSDVFLGNDSSCFHIADALNSQGIVTMGSTLCSKNGPINDSITVIRSPLKCASCQSTVFFRMCDEPDKCMDAIDPALIVAAFRNIIRRSK